jgi:preprotein translocase SecE subunit
VAETAKPKKRRIVKKAETVREKTEKSALPKPDKKTGVIRLALRYIAVPFKLIGKPFAKLGRFLGRFKAMRLLGRILWPTYFRNSWKELRQVTWPTRRETWQLTFAVILFSIIFGVLIAIVDFGLDKAFKELIIK